jgi:hypothetical protein
MKTFKTIGNIGLSFGNTIISVESNLFHTFNYIRKHRRTIRQVITPQVQYYNHPYNNKHKSTDKNPKNIPTSDWTFQPLNDLSCHDDSWYDAISP